MNTEQQLTSEEKERFKDIAQTIIDSMDHYREAGRDDVFNIESISEFLERECILKKNIE